MGVVDFSTLLVYRNIAEGIGYMLSATVTKSTKSGPLSANTNFKDEYIKNRISASYKWDGNDIDVEFTISDLSLSDSDDYILKNTKSDKEYSQSLTVNCKYNLVSS